MESLEEVADREEAERQQSLRDLEQLYEWLQQFEDPPPAPQPPPPQQFRNGGLFSFVLISRKVHDSSCWNNRNRAWGFYWLRFKSSVYARIIKLKGIPFVFGSLKRCWLDYWLCSNVFWSLNHVNYSFSFCCIIYCCLELFIVLCVNFILLSVINRTDNTFSLVNNQVSK